MFPSPLRRFYPFFRGDRINNGVHVRGVVRTRPTRNKGRFAHCRYPQFVSRVTSRDHASDQDYLNCRSFIQVNRHVRRQLLYVPSTRHICQTSQCTLTTVKAHAANGVPFRDHESNYVGTSVSDDRDPGNLSVVARNLTATTRSTLIRITRSEQ